MSREKKSLAVRSGVSSSRKVTVSAKRVPRARDSFGGKVSVEARALADRLLSAAPIALPVHLERAFYRTVANLVRNPSLARRRDAVMQRQMRNDPDIEGPMQALKVSIAGLDWQVNLYQGRGSQEIADGIRDLLCECPQFCDLQMQLLEAVWYGPSMVNLLWSRNGRGQVGIGNWLPIHSDTISSDTEGRVGLRVGTQYMSERPGRSVVVGFDGFVHPLEESERQCVALHTHQRRGGDFDEHMEAAYAHLGRGVRDVVWYFWLMKQTGMQNWMAYVERYAMGTRIGYYPVGHKNAKAQMESILRNMIGDVSACLPRTNPGVKDFEIEIKEAAAAKAKVFYELIAFIASNIKELIVGQAGTSEGVGGMGGSGVADQHAKTFGRHQSYVAKSLAETITREIVRPLVDMNWGPQEWYPVFEYSVADPDSKSLMEAAKAFVDMGGEIGEDFLARKLGFPKPRSGERVLSLETVNAAFGPAGGGPLGGVGVGKGHKGASNGHPVPATGEDAGDGEDAFARVSIRSLFDGAGNGDGKEIG